MKKIWLFFLQVHISREKITWPGATIKKKEEGMPSYDNNNLFGDLFITFDVEFPRGTLDVDEKEGMCHSAVTNNFVCDLVNLFLWCCFFVNKF